MRALPIVSALVLTLSALAACSAQPEGSPPQNGSSAGTTGSAAGGSPINGAGGTSSSFGGTSSGTAGTATTGFAGTTSGFAGSTSGFAGSTSGTAGSGSTSVGCAVTKVGAGLSGLIDDFETHPASALIPATDGRVGGWWISVGPTGSVTVPAIPKTGGGPMPVTGGMGGGMALHFTGTDTDAVKGWGADASVALAAMGNCYDASVYTTGIKLSMMGKGSVYVQVITAQDKAAMATSGNQRKEIPLTASWADYPIAWSELITGWGNPIALDPKSIVALDIAPSATSAISFDIWVDNVQFVK